MSDDAPIVPLDFLGIGSRLPDPHTDPSSSSSSKPSPPPSFPPSRDDCTRHFQQAPMSLKARENASRNLKRIFDQINSVPDNSRAVHSLLDALPFMEGRDTDARKSGAGQGSTNNAQESSHGRSSQELAESTDADPQLTRGVCDPRNPPQEAKNFLALQSSSDSRVEDESKSEGGSVRRSPQRSPDLYAPRPSAFRPLKQELPKESMLGLERRGSPPLQSGRCISPETNSKAGAESVGLLQNDSNQFEQEPPMASDPAKERAGDLDFSFPNKAQMQDVNQRAFRSPSPVPSFGPQQNDNPTRTQWPGNGLFPPQGLQHAPSRPATASTNPTRRQPTAQLTIFYSGMVNVYDDVPADKAHAIMLLAGSGNSWSSHFMNTPSSTTMAIPSSGTATAANAAAMSTATTRGFGVGFSSPMYSSTSVPPSTFSTEMKQQFVKRCHTELPHARKISLARFLEKRKDRVHQVKASANPTVESEEMVSPPEQQPNSSPKRVCSRPPSPSPPRSRPSYRSPSPHYVGDQSRPTTPQRMA